MALAVALGAIEAEPLALGEPLRLGEMLPLEVDAAETEALALVLCDAEPLAEGVGEALPLTVDAAETEALALALLDTDGEAESLALCDVDALGEVLPLELSTTCEADTLGVAELLGDTLGLCVCDGETLGVALELTGEGEDVALRVADGDFVGVTDAAGQLTDPMAEVRPKVQYLSV